MDRRSCFWEFACSLQDQQYVPKLFDPTIGACVISDHKRVRSRKTAAGLQILELSWDCQLMPVRREPRVPGALATEFPKPQASSRDGSLRLQRSLQRHEAETRLSSDTSDLGLQVPSRHNLRNCKILPAPRALSGTGHDCLELLGQPTVAVLTLGSLSCSLGDLGLSKVPPRDGTAKC